MKKITLFCVLIFVSLCACSHVISVEKVNFSTKTEPGKCYSCERKRDSVKTKGGFVIKIIENQYAFFRDSIRLDSIILSDGERMRQEIGTSQVSISVNKKLACFNTNNPSAYYALCWIEIPSEYRTISADNVAFLKKKGAFFYYYSRRVLLAQSYAQKIYRTRKPLFLNKNEYWFNNGVWSDYQEIICAPYCPAYTVKQIETALKKLGYRMKIDNKFSKKELKLLYRFQRKNGLESGKLNIETLKRLDIPY
jgi:hypothetical protein